MSRVTGKNLLHLIQRYHPFQGGSERYFQAFSERFVAAGDRVRVITTDAWDLEYFWDPSARHVDAVATQHGGVDIVRVPVRHLPLARISHQAIRRLMAETSAAHVPSSQRLADIGSRFGPWLPGLPNVLETYAGIDLIHSANIAFESMIAASANFARRRNIPHVVTPFLHLGEDASSRVRCYYTMPHQLQLLREADAVCALTDIEASFLSGRGVSPDRLHVVGAGLDRASVVGGDAERARSRFGLEGPIVLTLGAAAYDKGTMHLVKAVARLCGQGRRLTLVSAGPALNQFSNFLARLPDATRRQVRALGFVSDSDKRDLLAAADIFALPSRTESYGIVYLEAWANGIPVIGARAGAVPAVIEDEVDGLLVNFGDVAGLAAAIERLLDDPDLGRRLAERGASKVVDESVWFERIRRVYDGLIGVGSERGSSGKVVSA